MATAPKLRPLKTEDELRAVPLSEPVLVELPGPASGSEPDVALSTQQPPAQRQEQSDDVAAALRSQIEALIEADKTRQAQLERAERDRQDALRVAAERTAEATRYQSAAEQSENDSLTRGLSGAQAEREAAEAAYTRAFEAGDGAAMAAASAKIARTAAQIVTYESRQADASERVARAKDAPEQQRQQPQAPADVIAAIDTNPNLVPKERAWLKEHPEVLVDPGLNRELDVAYHRAVKAGHVRGTESYFKFIDQFMGYTKPDNGGDEFDTQERMTSVAAPVSRDSPPGSPQSPSRVILSPEQREMARNMDISETAYAKQVLRMQADKKVNPEKYFTGGR